jgi:hypothetical protein
MEHKFSVTTPEISGVRQHVFHHTISGTATFTKCGAWGAVPPTANSIQQCNMAPCDVVTFLAASSRDATLYSLYTKFGSAVASNYCWLVV